MSIENLKKEHCWRIYSVLGVNVVYNYDDLNKVIEKLRLLKVEITIHQLW